MRFIMKVAAAAALGLTVIVALTVPPSAQQGATGMTACRADIATFCKGIEAGGGKRVQCLQANAAKLQPACAAAIQGRGVKGAKAAGPAQGASSPTAQAPTAQTPTAPAPTAPASAAPQTAPPAASPNVAPPKAAVPAVPAGGVRPAVACRADLQALCGTVPAGGGAKMKCLRENQAKLSPGCADAITAKQAERQAAKADFNAACKDDGRALCKGTKGPERRACLTTNLAKLSPACADALGNAAVAPGAQPKAK